jgi:hypothetical protein
MLLLLSEAQLGMGGNRKQNGHPSNRHVTIVVLESGGQTFLSAIGLAKWRADIPVC